MQYATLIQQNNLITAWCRKHLNDFIRTFEMNVRISNFVFEYLNTSN